MGMVGSGGTLAQYRHAEEAPTTAVRKEGLISILALQAHGEVVYAGDRALIDAYPEVAVARREDRTHNFLCLDHVTEEAEVVHLPGELSAEHIGGRGGRGSRGIQGCRSSAVTGEGDRLVQEKNVGDDQKRV